MPSIANPSGPISAAPTCSWFQRIGPAIALLLLAPIVSEVLYGATRVSVIFVLIPEILTWGCGALLIRECVRRWHKGWQSMLLLGLALAVAEECVIQQTSIAPLTGMAKDEYGRARGVNWVYFLWALGYESVWVVLIPVQLTELLFSARRGHLWLGPRSFVVVSMVFVLGAFMAWYGWTQRARVQIFHLPPYSPPMLYILAGIAAILLLLFAAHEQPAWWPGNGLFVSHSAPSPGLVGLIGCALGAPWGAFVLVAFGWVPGIPFEAVLAGGLAWAALAYLLLRRWTSSSNWQDAHRLALVFGGVVACMLGGFAVFKVGGALRIDWIGKAVLNVAAVAWLVSLRRKVARRAVA